MNKENDYSSLWFEVDDLPQSTNAMVVFDRAAELTAEEQEAAKDDEALEAILDDILELEKQGLSSLDISNKVIKKIKEVASHLVPERNDYPPYDVSVERGEGWGTVVYFDEQSRRGGDDYDEDSWDKIVPSDSI